MSEACTLFCTMSADNLDSLTKRLSLLAPTSIDHRNEAFGWSSVECLLPNGKVKLTRQVFVQQADPFAKLVWTTIVKIQSKSAQNPSGASAAEKHLHAVESIIGIVAEPGFDQIDKLPELIGFLAMEFDALIFNGSDFMDFQGETIFSV